MHLSSRSRYDIDPSQPILGTLASLEVVIDRQDSHNHLPAETLELLETALFKVDSRGRDLVVEQVDFGHPIGVSDCVPTEPGDDIVLAHRTGRQGQTRFVRNKDPVPTSELSVVLSNRGHREGVYTLISAWLGGASAPEPWDASLKTDEAKRVSEEFWGSHALIWGSKTIDANRPIVPENPTVP